MLHAIPHMAIGLIIMATMFGLDKTMADALKTAAYFLLAGLCCADRFKTVPLGRLIAGLFLVAGFLVADLDAVARGQDRFMVVCRGVEPVYVGRVK